MSKEKTMSIKAYLCKDNGKPEVRRFALPEAPSYAALKQKVIDIFTLGDKELEITWQDSDGDDIILSSDAEFAEAIAYSLDNEGGQLLKIYINESSPSPSSEGQDDEYDDTHEFVNVVCDGCDGRIRGFRYKCMTCPDFDLCALCEGKKMHSQHQMIRITSKNNDPKVFFKQFHGPGQFQGHFGMHSGFGDGFGGFGETPGWRKGRHWGRRGCGNWGQWKKNNRRGNNGQCPFGGPFAPEGMANTEEFAKEASRMASKHAADIMKGIWTAWTGQYNPQESAAQQSNADGEKSANAESCSKASTESSSKTSTASANSSSKAQASPCDEYLKNVGQNVAEMLSPLGIDVEVSVEKNGVRQRCVNQEANKSTDGDQIHTEDDHYNKEPEEVIDMEVEKETPSPSAPEGTVSDTPDIEDWIQVDDESVSGQSKPSSVKSVSNPETGNASASKIYPNLPKAKVHSNPKIQRAIEHLCNMGYNNEEGWLSHLVEMKDGDINQVLDMLLPSK